MKLNSRLSLIFWSSGRTAWLLVLVTAAVMFWAPVAKACVICVPYPKTTHADLLVAGETVVAARENPDKPFSYRVVETLKRTRDAADIDLFLNSTARRKLSLNTQDVVVLARTRPGAESGTP